MNRKVFAYLRTLIYVAIVSVLSINLMACDPETPGTGNNNEDGSNDTPKVATITIGQYGSEAYCSSSALDFSKLEGLKAYVATGYDKGVVTLTRVKTIKSGEGFLVIGVSGDYEVPVIERSNDNTLNLLVGVLGNTTVKTKSEDGIYVNYYWNSAYTRFEPIDVAMSLDNSAYIQVPAEWKSWSGAELRFDDGEFANTENSK